MLRSACRTLLVAMTVFVTFTAIARAAGEDDVRFLRIGTGATGATYFSVGGVIASVLSNPPGSRPCEDGGSCGVPGAIVAAVSTQGSVDNVMRVAAGDVELALSQADVAFDAHTGIGTFAGVEPLTDLRAIANLYPEALHLVVAEGSGITSVPDLAGRRVSLAEPKSGTRVLARIVLDAYGMSEADVYDRSMKIGPAIDAMLAGELDALFLVAGYPADAITQAAEKGGIDILSIIGPEADEIRSTYPSIGAEVIPSGTYPGLDAAVTFKVSALLITSAKVDDELIYEVTRSLWNKRNRAVLDEGHRNARLIQLHRALDGVVVPIHPGAARFYEEIGLLPQP